jgi:chorismate-pyruvate lyase
MPGIRKANVPLGEVLRARWREARRMNKMAAKEDMSSVRRNARTVTTTWRAKTPRTADVVEVRDMSVRCDCR